MRPTEPSGCGAAPPATRRKVRTRTLTRCSLCRDSHVATARRIFELLDREQNQHVSWHEFLRFVRYTHTHFDVLVGPRGWQSPNPVTRFRYLVLDLVLNLSDRPTSERTSFSDEATQNRTAGVVLNISSSGAAAALGEQAITEEKLGASCRDGPELEAKNAQINRANIHHTHSAVRALMHKHAVRGATFEGRGLVTRTRRVFRLFDRSGSGGVTFEEEFLVSLHELGFFPYNVDLGAGRKMLLPLWVCPCSTCGLTNPCRSVSIRLAHSRVFEVAVVTTVLVNSIVVALEDPSDPMMQLPSGIYAPWLSPRNQFVFASEFVFTPLYFLEFCVKIVASGMFAGRHAYFRSWWNILDFVVLLSCLALLPFTVLAYSETRAVRPWNNETIAADASQREQEAVNILVVLRLLRILRPLKSLATVSHLRRLVRTLLNSVLALKDLMLVMLFLWFALSGMMVDLSHGSLERRCHALNEEDLLAQLVLDDGRHAAAVAHNVSASNASQKLALDLSSLWPATDFDRPCGREVDAAHRCFRLISENSTVTNGTRAVVADDLCLSIFDLTLVEAALPLAAADTFVWRNNTFIYNARMNYGLTNFDNLGFALLTVFQMTTLEGWIDVAYMLQDGSHDFVGMWVPFVIVIICGILMLSLILAVVSSTYESEADRILDSASTQWRGSASSIFGIRGFASALRSLREQDGALRLWVKRARQKVASRRANLRRWNGLDRRSASMDDDNETLPGEAVPNVEEERPAQHAHLGSRRSRARLQLLLRSVRAMQSRQMNWAVAVLVTINIALMLVASYSTEEYESCKLRRHGNLTAICTEADKDYIICIGNVVIVCLVLAETSLRWMAKLCGRGVAGTCAAKGWWFWHQQQLQHQLHCNNRHGKRGCAIETPEVHVSSNFEAVSSRKVVPIARNLDLATHTTHGDLKISMAEDVPARCTCHWRADDRRHDDCDNLAAELFVESALYRIDLFDAAVVAVMAADVVATGTCSLVPPLAAHVDENASWRSVLRAIAILRVSRLFVVLEFVKTLLGFMARSILELLAFGVLMLLFVYMTSLVGMQLFSNKFHFDADGYYVAWDPIAYNETCPSHAPWTPTRPFSPDQSNYDQFWPAALTTFQIWSGEDWNQVMYAAIRSGGVDYGPLNFLFFAASVIVGQWLLMNLLLAIMLRHFQLEALIENEENVVGEETGRDTTEPGVVITEKILGLLDKAPVFQTLDEVSLEPMGTPPKVEPKRLGMQSLLSEKVTQDLPSFTDVATRVTASHSNSQNETIDPRTVADHIKTGILGKNMTQHMGDLRRWRAEAWGVILVDEIERENPPGASAAGSTWHDSSACCCGRRGCAKLLRHRVYGAARSSFAALLSLAYIAYSPSKLDFGTDAPVHNTLLCYVFAVAAVFFWADTALVGAVLRTKIFKRTSSLVDALATTLLTIGCIGIFGGQLNESLRPLALCKCGLVLYIFPVLARLPMLRTTFTALGQGVVYYQKIVALVVAILFVFAAVLIPEYKGKLGFCVFETLNASASRFLQAEFGLNDGLLHYEFVKRGPSAARSPCEYVHGTFSASSNILTLAEQARFSRDDCQVWGGEWSNPLPNFDTFYDAWASMYHLSVGEGWVELMHRCVASVGQDQHPLQGFAPSRAIAFVVFFLVTSMVMLQLSSTFLVAIFEHEKKKAAGLSHLTVTQREWLGSMKAVSRLDISQPHRHPTTVLAKDDCCCPLRIRRRAYALTESKGFRVVTAVAIVLFMICCGLEGIDPTDQDWLLVIGSIEGALTIWFALETAINLVGYGGYRYFVRWEPSTVPNAHAPNTEDRIVCCRWTRPKPRQHRVLHKLRILDVASVGFCCISSLLSVAELLYETAIGRQHTSRALFAFFVTLRILRLFRGAMLLQYAPSVKQHFVALGHSAVAVGSIMILYFAVLSSAALVFRELFGNIRLDPQNYGGLDGRAHFQTWSRAFGVVARATTGEAWQNIVYSLYNEIDGCDDSFTPSEQIAYQANLTFDELAALSFKDEFGALATNGCSTSYGQLAFLLFVFLSVIVMMNLFLAVVVNAFDAAGEKQRGIVSRECLQLFSAAWLNEDIDVELFLEVPQVLRVLARSPWPLGLGLALDSEAESVAQTRQRPPESHHNALAEDLSGAVLSVEKQALRTVFGKLNLSLCNGRVYFYDLLTELLRVHAVHKARFRAKAAKRGSIFPNEKLRHRIAIDKNGCFFQSRAAVSHLISLDHITARALRARWHIEIVYAYTLSQAISAIVAQKIWRGHLVRRKAKTRRALNSQTYQSIDSHDESRVHAADAHMLGPFRKGSVSIQDAQTGTL